MAFTFLGGSVVLDLLATVRDWDGERVELLDGPAAFARWCLAARLVTVTPDVTEADLLDVGRLRELGYRLVRGASGHDPVDPVDREVLNGFAAHPPVDLSLDASGGLIARGTVAQVLASLARELVVLLSGDGTEPLRQCDGERCTRFFLDSSRARNRRFCSDRICGNRAKVAAHRRRVRVLEQQREVSRPGSHPTLETP